MTSKEQWEGRDGADSVDEATGSDAPGAAQPQTPGQGEPQPAESAAETTPRNLDQALDVIDRLREQVAAKSADVEKLADQLLRERAELENFKRRMQRERSEALRYASEHLLRDLLPVIDNLERAIAAASKGS